MIGQLFAAVRRMVALIGKRVAPIRRTVPLVGKKVTAVTRTAAVLLGPRPLRRVLGGSVHVLWPTHPITVTPALARVDGRR
jgi:hypothetical protein